MPATSGSEGEDAKYSPNDGHSWFATRGLFNLLPYIFGTYHAEGTSSNIYDPAANIAAAMNYIEDRYGGPLAHIPAGDPRQRAADAG
jgi:SLT domain-containing protein